MLLLQSGAGRTLLYWYLAAVITSANKVEVMWSFIHSVCLCVILWKSNEPISLKLGVIIEPTAPVLHTDYVTTENELKMTSTAFYNLLR